MSRATGTARYGPTNTSTRSSPTNGGSPIDERRRTQNRTRAEELPSPSHAARQPWLCAGLAIRETAHNAHAVGAPRTTCIGGYRRFFELLGRQALKVAVLSDIHGNAPALRAVLDELERRQPDLVVCCGDIAAGPMPRETIEELRGLGDRLVAVRGNADREVVEVFDGHGNDDLPPDSLWAGQQITRSQRDWLVQLPATVALEFDRLGTVLFCHATPRDDSEVVVETTPDEDLLESLGDVDADIIVCGNTHMQFDRQVNGYRIVNVGSVGMPYGDTGAFWVLLDRAVEFRRTKYDLEAAAQTIRSHSGWDMADAFAEENVMKVPSKEEALSFFESLP